MTEVKIENVVLETAAMEGMDEFMDAIAGAVLDAIGGELNGETMALLNAEQITLLAYRILRDEIMEGGFVQLIHNGYGAFIFKNPTARALKTWGLVDLGRLLQKAHKYYNKYHEQIEQDLSDDEFMALFEQCPEFDDFDDDFVCHEEQWTSMVACYLDDNLGNFVKVEEQ